MITPCGHEVGVTTLSSPPLLEPHARVTIEHSTINTRVERHGTAFQTVPFWLYADTRFVDDVVTFKARPSC